MEMHQLQYFLKVAEYGSFTRAAEQCLVSQPSLSQAIAKLEKELGQPVFQRLGRKVLLTDAGRILQERAQQILALAEDAKSRVADSAQCGRVTVAAIPTLAPYFLPKLLRTFSRRHPHAEVELHEDVTEVSIKQCLSGELDLALLALPVEEEQLHKEPLFMEELLLALPPGHPLANQPHITAQDVISEPFVLLTEAHCLSDQVVSFCRQRAFQPIVTDRASQLLTVQELVALGHGVSLIPAMACDLDKSRRRIYRSLEGDQPTRTLAMIWHKQRFQSQLVKHFIQLVREFAHQNATQAASASAVKAKT